MSEHQSVTVRVPAKLNLHLSVGARRPDGYHELATVFQAVSLYDEVTVTLADRLRVEVRGEGAGELTRGPDNLAARAVRALAAAASHRSAVRVRLVKSIPVAAGLAGGSADAAATLVACDALWNSGLDRGRLADIAAGLGSDVPFALSGGTALGTGRGEQLTQVLARGRYDWVLALADGGLSTQRVYEELDRVRSEFAPGDVAAGAPEAMLAALRSGDVDAVGRALANDLQVAACRLRPPLERLLDAGREMGVAGAVLCGSGPTVAFLCRDSAHAVTTAAALAGMGLCRGVRHVHGPVGGAAVLPASGSR